MYPLLFEPALYPKVWGGRALERLGKSLPAGEVIGESWEVADLASTSASGAGGGAARSVITNGPMKGRTLGDLVRAEPVPVLGRARAASDGGFPLLVKFLDAGKNLSVQVHPSPAFSRAHPGAHLKTECWYVLAAEPGARIYKGLASGVSRAELERAARAGDESIVRMLGAEPARVGECHTLPSGTVHALGAGVVVAEVQTPSDTTFRLYDWGRTGRPLHVDEALACADVGPAPPARRAARSGADVADTEYFTLSELRLLPGQRGAIPARGACAVVMFLSGRGTIESEGRAFDGVPFGAGVTALLPASIAPSAVLVPAEPGVALVAVPK